MRTLNAQAFNEICNHPEVRPWLGFPDPLAAIDLTPQIANPANFAFLTPKQDGGYLLMKLQPGLYAAHSLAVPEARGKPMLKLMREGFSAMFTQTDAVEIVTQVPDGNEGAKGWSELAGFRPTFRREAFFPLMGERVGCQFMSLTYADWAVKDRQTLLLGEQFHTALEAWGAGDHAPDKVHDCMVGATIAGIRAQNITKCVGLYNRWASVAGYAQATVVTTLPPVVDTGDAVIGLQDGEIQVLQVRSTPTLN